MTREEMAKAAIEFGEKEGKVHQPKASKRRDA